MGEAEEARPVKLIVGLLSGERDLLPAVRSELQGLLGPAEEESDLFPFDFTDYYEEEMGGGLEKKFFSFEKLIKPDSLAEIKLQTNELEKKFSREVEEPPRPVNLDPGYVGLSKLVLASTKNYSHRIYLRRGIYAEVTLIYKGGEFQPLPWTYPDYRTEEYRNFFQSVRDSYRQELDDN